MPDRKHISARIDGDVAAWLNRPHINTSGTVNAALRAYIGEEELSTTADETTEEN